MDKRKFMKIILICDILTKENSNEQIIKRSCPALSEKKILTAIAVFLLLLCIGCRTADKAPLHAERTAKAFGTTVRFTADGENPEAVIDECLERLNIIAKDFYPKNPEGSIARLNAAAGSGEWIALSPEAWHVLAVSQKYSGLTDGAWDITIAPLTSLWRKSFANSMPPAEEDIAAAKKNVGWKKLELRESDKTARLTEQGMRIDPGGAFKGFALDECRRIYAKHSATGLIDLGTSSIAAVGGKTKEAPFRVALRHPRKEAPDSLGIVPLKDSVLSTSGDYEHYFISDGIRYHHILDTQTGLPAQTGLSSVSLKIKADGEDTGLVSDILSTTFFVIGTEKSRALLPSLPVHVEAVFADEQGNIADTFGNILEK